MRAITLPATLLALLGAAGCVDFPLDRWDLVQRARRAPTEPAVARGDVDTATDDRPPTVIYVPQGSSTFYCSEGYAPYWGAPWYGGYGYGGCGYAGYGALGWGYAAGYPSGGLGLGYGLGWGGYWGGHWGGGGGGRHGYAGTRESWGIYGHGNVRHHR